MTIFGDLRAGLSPAVEELLEGFDSSLRLPLPRRELIVEGCVAAAFLAVAVAMVVLIPDQRALSIPVALVLVSAYAVASRVRFAIGYGFTVPTQFVFVPMLFLLPVGAVPLFVLAGIVASSLPEYLTGRTHPTRLIASPGDAWHAVGPALVLGIAGVADPDLSHWPVLLAALAAQLVFDAVASTLREWLALGISPKLQPDLLGWVGLVDVLLSPVGLLVAIASVGSPYRVLLALPLVGLLAIFASERKARVSQALELSRAYRGTTLLLGDVLEADDEYTGIHSQSVVSLSVAVADELGLSSSDRRNVEFGALLHDVGKIAVPKEIINKPGPLTPDEWVVIKAHTIEGQKMLDRVGGLLSDVGTHRALLARALGRHRLPGRPRRRRDPARLDDRLLLRRLQRHDHRSLVPRGDAAAGGACRASRLVGHAVQPGRRGGAVADHRAHNALRGRHHLRKRARGLSRPGPDPL